MDCARKLIRNVTLAHRAPEVNDLIWEHMPDQGTWNHDTLVPLLLSAGYVVLAFFVFETVLVLTATKLDLAADLNHSDTSQAQALIDTSTSIADPGILWLIERLFWGAVGLIDPALFDPASANKDVHIQNLVVSSALAITVSITIINLLLRSFIFYSLQKWERPNSFSTLQTRVCVWVSLLLVSNTVIALFIAHGQASVSTFADSFTNHDSFVRTAASRIANDRSCSNANMHLWDYVRTCYSGKVALLDEVFVDLIEKLHEGPSQNWYVLSGLVPQMILIELLDFPLISLVVIRDAVTSWLRRFRGRCCFGQRLVNSFYEPPDFRLALWYATLVKEASVVLIFGPAAPILYFIGGIALLLTWLSQRWFVLKLYRRPKDLDERITDRVTTLLDLLLLLHIACSPIFYVVQAFDSYEDRQALLRALQDDITTFHQRWHLFLFYLLAAYAGAASAVGYLAGLLFSYEAEFENPVEWGLVVAVVVKISFATFASHPVLRFLRPKEKLSGAEGKRYQVAREEDPYNVRSYRFLDHYPPKSTETESSSLHPKARSQDNPDYPERELISAEQVSWNLPPSSLYERFPL